MSASYDAIVVGGGPAGAATALCLAQKGRAVAIVERARFPRRKVCGEFVSATTIDLLDQLGVGDAFRALAGPPVSRVGLFAAGPQVHAPMPKGKRASYGQALGRELLDDLVLQAARAAGADVFQPARALEIVPGDNTSAVQIETSAERRTLSAPVIVAAHGSWEPGKLATSLPKRSRPHDYLGFKARFSHASLPRDIMPLIAFRGGYGGMVWSDHERVSLSLCIRRDALIAARKDEPDVGAGEAAFAHVLRSCRGVRDALGNATPDQAWLGAGPIRPGMRDCYARDIFRVGNLAAESHPIIAEGIAMALQSGWMLGEHLGQHDRWDKAARNAAGLTYSRTLREQFRVRIAWASLIAKLATMPSTAHVMQSVLESFPTGLSIGARLAGKTKALPH